MVAGLIRLVTGAQARWKGADPVRPDGSVPQRIFFANHTSNLDAPVIWASLPTPVRRVTRPVAARDYWDAGPVRRRIANGTFRAVLIERKNVTKSNNPLVVMEAALAAGDSLILFPEGGRSVESGRPPAATESPAVTARPGFGRSMKLVLASSLHVVLAALLFLAQGCQSAPPPPPRDYYFDSTGDDAAGSGTVERPYRSIAKANAVRFNPGDRVLFRAGETFAGNLRLDADDAGTAGQPVTIASYGPAGGGRATIDAGRGTGVRIENTGGVRVADLVVVGAGRRDNRGSGVEFVSTLRGGRRLAHVRIENVEVRGFGAEGVWVHAAPSDRSASGYDDVLIADCVARDNAHTGIYVAGCLDADPGEQPKRYAHTNVRVTRCLAAGNAGDPRARRLNRSGSGILLDGVDQAVVEHCEATGNGADSRATHGGPVGIWCTASNRVTIQFCKSHRNRTGAGHDGGGFCLDGGVCNSVLQHNVSEENDGSGYGLYQYAGAPPAFNNAVRHNVSRNDGRRNGYAGIHVWDDARTLRDVRVHNNEVRVGPAGPYDPPPRAVWFQSRIRSARVHDNVFVVEPGVRLMDVAFGQRQVRFENNTYQTGGDRVAITWEGMPYGSMSFWRQATGQDAVQSADAR